jgi:hypothetical protein
MAAANGNLFSDTTSYVTDYLMPRNNPGVTYVISEVSPSGGQGGVLLGKLYGGIYSAEFALRMSTLPQVKYVASFQMLSNAGIDQPKDYLNVVQAAYNSGTTTNTTGLNFGYDRRSHCSHQGRKHPGGLRASLRRWKQQALCCADK